MQIFFFLNKAILEEQKPSNQFYLEGKRKLIARAVRLGTDVLTPLGGEQLQPGHWQHCQELLNSPI